MLCTVPERDEQLRPSATVAPSRLPPWLASAHLIVVLLLKALERVAPKSSARDDWSTDDAGR